jgi:hypothetical protein
VLEEVPNKKAAVETFRALNKLPAKGWPIVPFPHRGRDKAKTVLYMKPRKDGRSGGGVGRIREVTRPKVAAKSEEGEDNQQRHQRRKQKTAATNGKHGMLWRPSWRPQS